MVNSTQFLGTAKKSATRGSLATAANCGDARLGGRHHGFLFSVAFVASATT
mgnify:FL=1|jgi:hypothetical protein